jgi:hypothetical protein
MARPLKKETGPPRLDGRQLLHPAIGDEEPILH